VTTIRRPSADELAECIECIEASIRQLASSHYDEAQLDAWIQQYPERPVFERWRREREMIVAVADGHVVGFGMAQLDRGEIEGVHVLPGRTRSGLGARILSTMESAGRSQSLEILEVKVSLNAIDFYESCGYREEGPTKFTCQNGVQLDAVAMKKRLSAHEA